MSHVISITDDNFEQEVLQSEIPVVVDLSASWCGPCMTLAPVIESLAEKYTGKAKVGKLDIDENPHTAKKLSIMGVPTTVLFNQGREENRIVGLAPVENFADMIEPHIQKEK